MKILISFAQEISFLFFLMQFIKDIIDFVFPRNCILCGRLLNNAESVMCIFCYYGLPRTNFHRDPENPVAKLFWGRTKVDNATSYFYFHKGSTCQKLIHGLKYQGRRDIGVELGKMFGNEIRETAFAKADFIIPVPLHPKKQRKRGYNQSEMIAGGIGMAIGKEVITDVLERVEYTATQTNKSRFDRYENIKESFRLKIPELCHDRHILLVDDVVTTGSTMEACVEVLLSAKPSCVSIATLAVA